jgi:hypothetical protein
MVPVEVKKPDLLFGYVMQNSFALMLSVTYEKNEAYRSAIKQIEFIISLIDNELD